MTLFRLLDNYLDYKNNYTTIKEYAIANDVEIEYAFQMINYGRIMYQRIYD